ncbi:MAG: hypothetical protein ACPG5B_00540 [Chitinophagales bacterium]
MNTQYLTTFFCLFFFQVNVFGQYFEGELTSSNIYLVKGTQTELFSSVLQKEYYKGNYYKVQIPDARDGQMDWIIEYHETKRGYEKKSDVRTDTSYIVTDQQPTYDKDGKIQFKKMNPEKKRPIISYPLCKKAIDSSTIFKKLDTTFVIGGLLSKVMLEYRGNEIVRQYYYCDTVKINPLMYSCPKEHSRFYNLTDGALITQIISYKPQVYDYVYLLERIESKAIDEKTFAIPKNE